MNFYQDIIDRLYVWNTTKGDTNFADPYAFIEAKHFESNDKDFIFYERLLHEMPNHFDPMMRSDLLKEIILYCNRKIDSYKSDYEQPDFIYSITGEPLFFEIKNDKVGQALKPNEKCRKEHALDILNYAIVSIEGEVEHPDQNFYDNKFIKAINSTPNKAEEIRYINHHYNRAKKKNVFLRKIDNLFDRTRKYPTDEVLTQDARSILLEWYNSEIEKYPQLVIEQVDLLKYRNMKIEVKYDIETFELEKCIYLMGFWINDDSKVISEFLDKESDIDEKYVTPFVKELNMNLLRKDTHEAKRDLIKYYIFQFIEIQGFLDIHKNIIEHKPDSKGDCHIRNTSEVKTDFEKYVIICSQYFDVFFNVIQLCCNNYNIDFFKACLELNFPLDFIDSGISLFFNENKNNTLPPQQTEMVTEQEAPKKFIANEYALAYIFDLYATGKRIPENKTEGGYNKKELIKKGVELYQFDKKKDTFYRAVKHVASFDLNNKQYLEQISKNWVEAVSELSKDWCKTKEYLIEKELIRE